MYCQECGMKLPDNAKFCSNCGTEVNLPVKKLKKENKKSKKKLLGIIAGVFVMLAVVVGGFFVYLENRTLFYLINPEMFFGECTDYVIFRSAPGRSWVELEFEAETDFFENVLKYVDCVEILNPDLEVYDNTLDNTEGWRSVEWRVDEDKFFWHEYSLSNTGLFDVGISYQYDMYYEKYEVSIDIHGYQNCEFIDAPPYVSEAAGENTPTPTATSEVPDNLKPQAKPTSTPAPTQKASNAPIVEPTTPPASIIKPKSTTTPKPTSKPKATATPMPTAKPKATSTPKPTKTPTPVPTKAAAKDLVAPEIDVATAVQPPKNAFQDFASWGMGAVVSADAEQSDSSVQYLDYQASQATVDAYIEMLLQNGFTLVDEYFFQYQSDPFASWALNCDYVPDAGKVEMQYESSTICHLCISTYKGDYTFNYSSDLTQYDLGLRKDGSVEKVIVNGPSAGAGLYRSADGVYTTTDGRLSASMNKATIIRDGKKDVCTAKSEIKNGREWIWVEDYYRNEAICFGVLQDYTMAGDLYQYQDLKREKYYNDDKDVYYYKWGDQPIFEMTVDNKFTGPLVTSKNEFEEVTVRVMHYEEGVEAVYYIYAKTKGTPSEIEVLCAVGLNVEEAENDAENAIVLSVGETYTITYNPSTFGALSEVYSWSISGGDGIYADGTGRSCKVTAMKKGTGKVTATCIYTVKAADILTGNPTTEQRSTSKTWYFKVE